MTKRLIIEGDWILRESPRGKYWCIDLDAERVHIAWPDDPGVTVEDVPDPLPTKPGTRFWGKETDHPAEWYFVMESNSHAGYMYASARGSLMFPGEIERRGLVRLPDPEATR